MTTENALKKIAKAGLTYESEKTWDGEQYWVRNGGYTFEFYSIPDWQDESKMVVDNLCIVNSKALAADTNQMNGNCYNSFYPNFSQAMRSFTGK